MNLKNTLQLAFRGNRDAIHRLCKLYQQMAVSYLRMKVKSHSYLYQFYPKLEDLAHDCIADLFDSREGHISKLRNYYEDIPISEAEESLLFTKTRQLVFSKVNDGIFENYRKVDPSLSKIIRNLKHTLVHRLVPKASFDEERREIVFGPKSYKPQIPVELLQIKMASCISSVNNSIRAIEALSEILEKEEDYEPRVQLIAFALSLRKLNVLLEQQEDITTGQGDIFQKSFIEDILNSCMNRLKPALIHSYVDSGKMGIQTLNNYLQVVHSILIHEFIRENTNAETQYEHFCSVFGETNRREYREYHRFYIEYMVKKIRSEFVGDVRKDILKSAVRVR